MKAKEMASSARRDLPGENLVRRIIVANIRPSVDNGKFAIKRTRGESVLVGADIFTDGHDVISAVLLYRKRGEEAWDETAMKPKLNDVFEGEFTVESCGYYEYTVEAWINRFESWRQDLIKKNQAGMKVKSELLEGAVLLRETAKIASRQDKEWLQKTAAEFQSEGTGTAVATGDALREIMLRYPDKSNATRYEGVFPVLVERERARFGAWYEFFPRSCTTNANIHGTFSDCERRLPYIADMSFDIVYLPPVHPIGNAYRKGPNNTLDARDAHPGSPWAIGSKEGGHKSLHPALGELKDLQRFIKKASEHDLEVALDIAFQCSPDHPYVSEKPQWFRHRPDGTIKYAENPPKKYQDIYPLDLECEDWQNLWNELRDVIFFWTELGIRIFRVDNPHTKPFRFWEWLIASVREKYPDVIFLSEAFTRPKVLQYLAKIGFSQSYTYFTWRNTKYELTQYMTELTQTGVREYLRPNFFANTPDILHEYLQFGGRPAFQVRVVLSATLAASYGIYGPAFELCENRAIQGTEEYLDSEKYQIRVWNLDDPQSIKGLIKRLNHIRRENPALQSNDNLQFYAVDNEQILCYGKSTPDLSNIIIVVVNLDPHYTQSGWVRLPLEQLKLDASRVYQVHDLLSEARYLWQGETNYVELNPKISPAHVFLLRRKIKTEHDFDYFL